MGFDERQVLIAGGGPVGLLCAWLLGRRGLSVRLFDVNETLQADPRAATTHPATLDLLADDGLADDMARLGLVAPIFQFWDRPSREKIAKFDHVLLNEDTSHPFVVQCEQVKTAKLILSKWPTTAGPRIIATETSSATLPAATRVNAYRSTNIGTIHRPLIVIKAPYMTNPSARSAIGLRKSSTHPK